VTAPAAVDVDTYAMFTSPDGDNYNQTSFVLVFRGLGCFI